MKDPFGQAVYDFNLKGKAADLVVNSNYTEDEKMSIRKSHENPEVIKLYEEFLGAPLGELSHKLLHTKYTRRERV